MNVSDPPILDIQHLTKRYGDVTAVDGCDLTVMPGEIVGLLGPNGAGKSTMIKMLTTLLRPTSGTASVAGYDIVRDASHIRRVIGYVPQLLSADGALSGSENLQVFASLYDVPSRERNTRIQEALDFMGLASVSDKLVRTYSGGMIRRLEIAQSMLHRPPVLFLDEPTVGLDPTARHIVWERVARLCEDFGTTILLTTHYMEEADELCNRVAFMHNGKMTAIGTPDALKQALGDTETTLDDVFAHYTGSTLREGGSYRETVRSRRTTRRLS